MFNPLNHLVGTQLGWASNRRSLYEGVVTTMIPAGALFGTFVGNAMAGPSRRNALLLNNLFVAAGCGVSLVKQMIAICVGRFVFGVSAGVFSVVVPLFIQEVSPVSMSGSLGAINQFMIIVGVMIAMLLGLGVPEKDSEAERTSEYWRYMFGLPLVFVVLQLLLLLLVFVHDTPKNLLKRGNLEAARRSLASLYGEARADAALAAMQ